MHCPNIKSRHKEMPALVSEMEFPPLTDYCNEAKVPSMKFIVGPLMVPISVAVPAVTVVGVPAYTLLPVIVMPPIVAVPIVGLRPL
jgi:hypothetical protein